MVRKHDCALPAQYTKHSNARGHSFVFRDWFSVMIARVRATSTGATTFSNARGAKHVAKLHGVLAEVYPRGKYNVAFLYTFLD